MSDAACLKIKIGCSNMCSSRQSVQSPCTHAVKIKQSVFMLREVHEKNQDRSDIEMGLIDGIYVAQFFKEQKFRVELSSDIATYLNVSTCSNQFADKFRSFAKHSWLITEHLHNIYDSIRCIRTA